MRPERRQSSRNLLREDVIEKRRCLPHREGKKGHSDSCKALGQLCTDGGGPMLVQQLPKTQLLKQYGSFVSFQEDMHAG
jgi:hypothetical protein